MVSVVARQEQLVMDTVVQVTKLVLDKRNSNNRMVMVVLCPERNNPKVEGVMLPLILIPGLKKLLQSSLEVSII